MTDKIKLAREIAYRTTPRFVDIEPEKRVTRGTAMKKLRLVHPEIEAEHAEAMKRKTREENRQ